MVAQEEIVGIYDADGGWGGEIRYAMKILAGGKHCSLCDITHGWNPLGRKEWRRACEEAPFRMRLIHRDQASDAQRQAAVALPAILAGDGSRWRLLVDTDQLEGCNGDPDRLMALIRAGL